MRHQANQPRRLFTKLTETLALGPAIGVKAKELTTPSVIAVLVRRDKIGLAFQDRFVAFATVFVVFRVWPPPSGWYYSCAAAYFFVFLCAANV